MSLPRDRDLAAGVGRLAVFVRLPLGVLAAVLPWPSPAVAATVDESEETA